MDEIGFRVGCISSTTVITHKNIQKIRAKTFKKETIQSAFRRTGIWPLNPDVIIKAFKLTQDTQIGDKDTSGRVYNHTPGDLSTAINVPASNEPIPRWIPVNNEFWEAETASDEEYDYIPWTQNNRAFNDEPEDRIELPQLPRDGNVDITDDLIAPLASSHIDELLDSQESIEVEPLQPRGVEDYGNYSTADNPHGAKRVKPRSRGRVISSREGLRIIGERNDIAQESKLTKLQREANIAGNILKLEEERVTKALARQQKREEKEAAKVQKRIEKAHIREEKAQAKIQHKLDKAMKLQALISTGKKPRGRKSTTIKDEEATQQEPVIMAASQRPIRARRSTQKAIEIPSDIEQEDGSDIESLLESDSSASSDSDVNLSDNSGGGPVDYDDYN
ncbi:hypothetical protein ACEPPN_010687 [Leptodophora sp. 'Broadleaf-Isolate-01']